MLHAYQLDHVRHTKGSALSGREQRRLQTDRAMLCEPKMLLLDEPFTGVEPIAIQEMQRFSQNVRKPLRICQRAYLIAEGKILA